jgi:hypothetical protein
VRLLLWVLRPLRLRPLQLLRLLQRPRQRQRLLLLRRRRLLLLERNGGGRERVTARKLGRHERALALRVASELGAGSAMCERRDVGLRAQQQPRGQQADAVRAQQRPAVAGVLRGIHGGQRPTASTWAYL